MEQVATCRLVRFFWLVAALSALLPMGGCLRLHQISREQPPLVYIPEGGAPGPGARLAPHFRVFNPQDGFNRLGRPRAHRDGEGWEHVTVDVSGPAIYHGMTRFATGQGQYTNLVYRVHFPATPFSIFPFFIGAGENMGLLVVITLDQAQRPVLVATAGTCGCYLALVPTDLLPAEALPEDWRDAPQEIFGETLPARLDWSKVADPVLMVSLRPGEHRVMDLAVVPRAELASLPAGQRLPAELHDALALERLPLEDSSTSMFHGQGPLDGHVKGAWKPWETLLMSWFSLDLLVGMDKAYPARDNPFYTSLKPWARQDSDMRDFARFLRYWGWRL